MFLRVPRVVIMGIGFHQFCLGIIPLIILMYLNLKILQSLQRLRIRLGQAKKNKKQGTTWSTSLLYNTSVTGKVQLKQIAQQSKDTNLAFILVSTVCMFLCCHLPR